MLKSAVLKYLTQKKEAQKPSASSESYKDAKLIGLIFSETIDFKGLTSLRNEIKKDGKQVELLMHIEKFDKEKEYEFPYFDDKAVKISGGIESEAVRSFVEKSYDMILVLDNICHPITQFITSKCNAPLRMGYYEEENANGLLNFMIKPKNGQDPLHKELIAYLRKIS